MSTFTASTVTVDITDPNTGIAAIVVEAIPSTGSVATKVTKTFNLKEVKSSFTVTNLKGNTHYTVRVKVCAIADGSDCSGLSEGVTPKNKIGSEFKATILSS